MFCIPPVFDTPVESVGDVLCLALEIVLEQDRPLSDRPRASPGCTCSRGPLWFSVRDQRNWYGVPVGALALQ